MKHQQMIKNRYSIHDRIGQGGMGTVYRGLDTKSKEAVAVKHLKSDVMRANPEILKRFQREGELLRQLNHPNIVHLLDFVEEDDQHYMVLEFVGGGSLADLLRDYSQLSINQVLHIALDICDALTRAHHLGIIHRDLKPSNVLLSTDGRPLLSDFGVAHANDAEQITQTGAVIGTSAYLAPESLAGHPPDERSDIWAFGILLFQLLTGHTPYPSKRSVAELFSAILHDPIPDITQYRPDAPIALVQLLYAMLEKDHEKRIGSTRQIGATLESILSGTPPASLAMVVDHDLDETMTIDLNTTSTDSSINLPTPSTPFVGRDVELEEIRVKIAAAECRLLTLVGAGGMGKTRLAIQTAKDTSGLFPDGVHFVALASVDSADLIVSAIASSVGFAFFGDESPLNQLLAYLREKQLLLVMDNFEHLTGGATILSNILENAANVKIIVTSRERLNLQGEWVHAVAGMHYPETPTETDLDSYSAVKLFEQGATRVQPDFSLKAHLPDVLRIIDLVGGTPLGVELATAWLRFLPPSEIADEIEKSFDFLESSLRNVPERQRSMRAVFEYSWELMTDDERAALARLSIFAGGFNRDAACSVADTSLRILSALVDKSLLSVSRTGRYTMHTLVKTYAEEKLKAVEGEIRRLREKHVQYFAHRLEQIFPMEGIAEENQFDIQLLATDMDNVRAMWRWAVEMNMYSEIRRVLRLLWISFEMRGLVQEAAETFKFAADHLQTQAASPQRDNSLAFLLTVCAWYLQRTGDYTVARDVVHKAVGLAEQHDDTEALAFGLAVQGYVHQYISDYDTVIQSSQAAYELFKSLNSQWGMALSIGTLGYVNFILGDYATAERNMNEGLSLSKSMGHLFGQAYSASNLGELYMQLGKYEKAQALFDEANHKFGKLDYQWGQAVVINNLGELARLKDDQNAARDYFMQAYDIYQGLGNSWGVAQSLTKLGRVENRCDKCMAAEHFLEQALILHRDLQNASGIITTLTYLGDASIGVGKYAEADRYFEEALQLATPKSAEPQLLDIIAGYASLWAKNGDAERALEAYSLVAHHSATDYETRLMATHQLDNFRSNQMVLEFDEVVERGKQVSLQSIVPTILAG